MAVTSKTYDILQALRADILACRLPPGEHLKINQLAAARNVSLSSIREALSTLAAEGLVIAEPQRGFRVTPISAADLTDLSRVRNDIEAQCLASAIRNGGIEWETGIVAALHRLNRTPERAKGDPDRLNEEWSVAHELLHQALLSSCDSPWLLRIRKLLSRQAERYRKLSIPLAEENRNILHEHEQIAEATLARDVERAKSLLVAHFDKTVAILLASNSVLMAEPARERSLSRSAEHGELL